MYLHADYSPQKQRNQPHHQIIEDKVELDHHLIIDLGLKILIISPP